MKIEPIPDLPITPGRWLPARSHEDHTGPLFDIDAEERAQYDARPFTQILSATGETAVTAHDLFKFRSSVDAAVIAKVPELLQIAVWAEAALGYASGRREFVAPLSAPRQMPRQRL
jgi:hypothetical protein